MEIDHFENLIHQLDKKTLGNLKNTYKRLKEENKKENINDLKILLPFGGGKDSAWVLFYVRMLQYFSFKEFGDTFKLKVFILTHPGVTKGVYKNINSVFNSLKISKDSNVQVIAVTLGNKEVELDVDSFDEETMNFYRIDTLLSSHKSQGNGRETFCNTCNLSIMNSITRQVMKHDVDLVITGDSKKEIVQYMKWVNDTSKSFKLNELSKKEANWVGVFNKLSEINNNFFEEHLDVPKMSDTHPYFYPNLNKGKTQPKYFSIFKETNYEFWMHDKYITEVIGFELYSDGFNFSESDCGNPRIMLYLRGVYEEFVGGGYISGVKNYLKLTTYLMNKKQFNDEMMDYNLNRYSTDYKILLEKEKIEGEAFNMFGILPLQWKCSVASPFTNNSKNLEKFLKWCLPHEINNLVYYKTVIDAISKLDLKNIETASFSDLDLIIDQTEKAKYEEIYNKVLSISGLDVVSIRNLSKNKHLKTDKLELLLEGDPHKIGVDSANGEMIISGR